MINTMIESEEIKRGDKKNAIQRCAQIISDFFAPLLVPTYGMAIAMWLTPLRFLPEGTRLFATLTICFITGVIPLVIIVFLKFKGLVSDNSISRREQRPLPMLMVMCCYIVAALYLGYVHAPLWLRLFFYGAAIATAIASVITLKWKISAHTTAMGGLVGLVVWLTLATSSDLVMMIVLSIVVIISGAVATARLILNRHTLMQVIAGLCLGFVCTFGFIMLF